MHLSKKSKTFSIILIKLLLTSVAFYVISKRINFNPLSYLNKSSVDYFLLAFALSVSLVFLQSLRWKYIVKMYSIQLPFMQCLIAVWVGHLVNNFLPAATAGDLLRSYTLRYADNENRKWKWLGGYISEKYSAAASALFIASFVLITSISHFIPIVLTYFIVALCIALVLLPIIATKIMSEIKFNKMNKILIYLREITKACSNNLLNKYGRYAFLISIFTSITMCIAFYIIALGLGAQIKFIQCLFIVPVFTLLASLPISYAGWGVRELSCVGLLSFFGVPSEIAVIISVMYGLIFLLSSLPGIMVAYSFVSSIRNLSQKLI